MPGIGGDLLGLLLAHQLGLLYRHDTLERARRPYVRTSEVQNI